MRQWPKIALYPLLLLCLLDHSLVNAQSLLPEQLMNSPFFSPVPSKISGARTAASSPPRVRVAYVVPSNRTPQGNYKENLQFAIEMVQMWYRNNMNQNGFGPKTFLYEPEENSPRPKIHLVNTSETDSYLRGANAYEQFDRVKTAAKNAGLSVDSEGEVWVIISETQVQNPNGSFIGGLALGGGGGSGTNSGIAQLGSNVIQLFSPQRLLDNTPYAGQIVPEWGPYPLVQDASFVWFEGKTFSSVASSYLGALCHEMGHAFGLNHDARQDNNFFGGLMFNGLRGIRGSFFPLLYPDDYTRLEFGSSVQLNQSHYFNRGKKVTPVPVISTPVSGPATPVNGLLNVSFWTADPDTIAYAQLFDSNGNVIGEEVYISGTTALINFKTAYYTAGQANTFYVAVCDRQGNRRVSPSFSLSVPAGINQAPIPFLKILRPNAPYNGNNTLYNVSSTVDPNGDTFTTEIDFNNDGIYDTPSFSSADYWYSIPQPGPYLSRIRVTDSHGALAVSSPISGNYGNTCGVDAPTISGPDSLCSGASAQLTAYGCYGALLWSNGATSPSITISPTSSMNYTVTCYYGCGPQTGTPFRVEVVESQVTLSGSGSSGVQRATQTILSTQEVSAGNTVLYIAGNSITLLPGFVSQKGSVFTARTEGCRVD